MVISGQSADLIEQNWAQLAGLIHVTEFFGSASFIKPQLLGYFETFDRLVEFVSEANG